MELTLELKTFHSWWNYSQSLLNWKFESSKFVPLTGIYQTERASQLWRNYTERLLDVNGCSLCGVPSTFRYFSTVWLDKRISCWGKHCSCETTYQAWTVFSIKSIHKRYRFGRGRNSIKHDGEWLSSQIACDGLTFSNRDSSNSARLGIKFCEFSQCF